MSTSKQPAMTAIVVAAGVGARMGDNSPKQYRIIAGKTMLQHSIDALLAEPRITRLIVVVSPSDLTAQKLTFADKRVVVARVGGLTRTTSVKNALSYAAFTENEWVLVHDASRPCLLTSDVTKLIDVCTKHEKGGILAVPVSDTLKKEGKDRKIAKTISREDVWAAQTPQMFRAFQLIEALDKATKVVTDEASAVEQLGIKPLIVEGTQTNIKVTYPMDLWMAQAFFHYRDTLNDK